VFVGTYEHSVDGKGRLVLPSKFRVRLPEGGYLAPHANGLALWPPTAFQEMVDRLTEQVRAGTSDPDVVLGVTANAEEVAPDAQGRILLPPRLRELAAVAGDVVLLGVNDHIQIWALDTWRRRRDGITRSSTDALAAGRGT
jgi:MraZ protein